MAFDDVRSQSGSEDPALTEGIHSGSGEQHAEPDLLEPLRSWEKAKPDSHTQGWLERTARPVYDDDEMVLAARQAHADAAERTEWRAKAQGATQAELQALINARIEKRKANG